jgi:hypothetical protein
MFTTAETRMVVVMLAEGNPVWYVAAQMRRHSADVQQLAESYGYPDARRLRRAAAQLTRTAA